MTDENLPVSWEDKMALEAREGAALERPSISTISLKSGMISYMGQLVPENKLECIVVASMHENVIYGGDYDPDNPQPPVCWAFSPNGNLAPIAEDVGEPISETCEDCPNMEWGSAPGKSRGKACKEIRRLALIPSTAQDLSNVEMAMLKVPVMSVKNWSTYVNTVSSLYKRPVWGIKTIISTVPDPKSQFRVTFQAGELLPDELLGAVNSKIELAYMMLKTPYDLSGQSEQVEEAPEKGKRKY